MMTVAWFALKGTRVKFRTLVLLPLLAAPRYYERPSQVQVNNEPLYFLVEACPMSAMTITMFFKLMDALAVAYCDTTTPETNSST